jgi:hypothetical protein
LQRNSREEQLANKHWYTIIFLLIIVAQDKKDNQ